MHLRRPRASFLAPAAALAVAVAGLVLAGQLARPSVTQVSGAVVDQPVPSLALADQYGNARPLPSFAGRVVVLAPFLAQCSGSCPLTTGAFFTMERDVTAAGLGGRVAFVQVTVDPERDTPARLRAFARRTGADWTLLTGAPGDIAALWQFFGVYSERGPAPSPAAIDWQTGQAVTYAVTHTDALFFIGSHGHVRALIVGGPTVGATLPPALAGLLDADGRQELAHPQGGWTVRQALDDLGLLLGHQIAG